MTARFFIKLTDNDDGNYVRVAIDCIESYFVHSTGATYLSMKGNIRYFLVKETPEEIDRLLKMHSYCVS